MALFSMAGRSGASTSTISALFYSLLTITMSSSRDLNCTENTGYLATATNRFANWAQKKADKFFGRDSTILGQKKSPHLFKNRDLGGYFDYQSYAKYEPRDAKKARTVAPRRKVLVRSIAHSESRRLRKAHRRKLIGEMLLRELPGLDASGDRGHACRQHLEERWNKLHAGNPDDHDVFAIVRRDGDIEAIARKHSFKFLPEEICLLQIEIAAQELLEIEQSKVLDREQFEELIHVLAVGWPGVVEDSASPLAEDRVNAAGCVRALADFANKGALPREVLSGFRELDAINRALLERAALRRLGDGDADAKERGRKLAGLHADLVEAERNLRAVGIDIRGVRVDEHYIHGLDTTDKELRQRSSLMLARVALIQEEIAKIDTEFEGHVEGRKSIDRLAVDKLLSLGLTADDVEAMALPDDPEAQRQTIGKLGKLGFRNAQEVALQHRMHRKMKDRIFRTRAGRRVLKSAFHLTTAQLGAEYLHAFFSAVTGDKDNYNHRASDARVVTRMKERWDEIMPLSRRATSEIDGAGRDVQALRQQILMKVAKLGMTPEDDADIGADIARDHAEINKALIHICDLLSDKQLAFLRAMIRAAVLAARPHKFSGEKAAFDPADLYDAGRYRQEIDDLLKSWGMEETDLFQPLIDLIAFSRAEDSEFAPGTVTARKVDAWKRELDVAEIFGAAAAQPAADGRPKRSLPARVKELSKQGAGFVVESLSGKRYRKLDPVLIERILVSLPALSDHDKISLRINTTGQGGATLSSMIGVRGKLGGGAGDQASFIIKREGGFMVFRCLAGVLGYGQLGFGFGSAIAVGEVDLGVTYSDNYWETGGVSLAVPIPLDEHGQEDFSKAQTYLRSLLTGTPLTTEAFADLGADWSLTDRNGNFANGSGMFDVTFGAGFETPVGAISVGFTGAVGVDKRRTELRGVNSNAHGTTFSEKQTDMTTLSGSAAIGATVGYKAGADVVDLGLGAAALHTSIGVTAGAAGLSIGSMSVYDEGSDRKLAYFVDTGPVDSVEEMLGKIRPDLAQRLHAVLDKETTLQNGSTGTFRDELEKMRKIIRFNDGLVVAGGLRPEVKKEVARRQRRLSLIGRQMLPIWTPRIANEQDGVKRQKREQRLQAIQFEIAAHKRFIADARDPANLQNFELLAVGIAPSLLSIHQTTALNLNLARLVHVGVRGQDHVVALLPVPKEDPGETGETPPDAKEDVRDPAVERTIDQLSRSLFPTTSPGLVGTRKRPRQISAEI